MYLRAFVCPVSHMRVWRVHKSVVRALALHICVSFIVLVFAKCAGVCLRLCAFVCLAYSHCAHTCTVSMCSDCTHVSSVRGLYICWLRACAHGHDVRAYVQKVCSKLRLCLVLAQASSEHMCMCLRIAATIEIFRVFHRIVRLQIVFESKVIRKAFFNPQNPEHDAHFH